MQLRREDYTLLHTLYPGHLVAVFDTLNREHFIRQKKEHSTEPKKTTYIVALLNITDNKPLIASPAIVLASASSKAFLTLT